MGIAPRLSLQGLRVLRVFLNDPTSEFTGAEILRASSLASGTVYPLLLRFERVGILESHWEAGNPSDLGHPRRRYYRITHQGRALAQQELTVLAPEKGIPSSIGGVKWT